LMRYNLPGKRDDMRMRLNLEQIPDGAHDQAVHHQSGSERGEFGREGVHVRLLNVIVIDPYP
jgi:hypothetical protein